LANAPPPSVAFRRLENWDISVFKSFPVRERITFQFRCRALNAFNTPQFRAPNTAVGNSNFGAITQQANFRGISSSGTDKFLILYAD